jgi:hypothetical protein
MSSTPSTIHAKGAARVAGKLTVSTLVVLVMVRGFFGWRDDPK